MGTILPNSPFGKTDFQNLGEYHKKGSHLGLLLPNGEVIINFEAGTSHSVLAGIAKTLKAKMIIVTGTWTFEPDKDQEYREVYNG